MAARDEIIRYCDERLDSASYQDVAVNGLQVAGERSINRLAVAVSTSQYTLTAADDWAADALLVHHGLLWGSGQQPLVGTLADRLRILFHNDMNLIAYHLPLDGHPELGNCALLSQALGFEQAGRFASIGGQYLGVVGESERGVPLQELINRIGEQLERSPTAVGLMDSDEPLHRVGFLTGSGYSTLLDAHAAGCQALVTGDIREPTMAEARELGMTVIAGGHEATERFGVQALANEIANRFEVETRFIHDPNPI